MDTAAYSAESDARYVGKSSAIVDKMTEIPKARLPKETNKSLYVVVVPTNEVYELPAEPALTFVGEYQMDFIPLKFYIGDAGLANKRRG